MLARLGFAFLVLTLIAEAGAQTPGADGNVPTAAELGEIQG
jgi:hypothetical protein